VSDRARVPECEGANAIGSSHGYFGFIVQPFDSTAGELLLGLEVVEQQGAVSAQGAGNFLHRLDAGTHGLIAPEIQKIAGPGGRVVFPELLKIFF
jgi:hypothetical protein